MTGCQVEETHHGMTPIQFRVSIERFISDEILRIGVGNLEKVRDFLHICTAVKWSWLAANSVNVLDTRR